MRFFYLVLHRRGREYSLPGLRLLNGWCIVDGWLPFASVDYLIEVMCERPGDHVQWI